MRRQRAEGRRESTTDLLSPSQPGAALRLGETLRQVAAPGTALRPKSRDHEEGVVQAAEVQLAEVIQPD